MLKTCPICKSGVLDHDDTDIEEDRMVIRVICADCGWVGYEVFKIHFSHLEDLDGNKI